MAEQFYDKPINKHTDWGGDNSTGNLPVTGKRVQEFIKGSLDKKVGELYYDASRNRYLLFADEENRDKYFSNPDENADLLMGTFDAPVNYTAEIVLASPTYVSITKETTGNYIEFTFDTKNKNGQSVSEDVTCTYTFRHGSTNVKVTEKYRAGSNVKFNIDKYLVEGANSITIGIIGVDTLAAITTSVTYQVVNLTLSDTLDISRVYDLNKGENIIEIPFSVSGYGTKVVEWYVGGEQLEFDKNVDEIVDVKVDRVKYIDISQLNRGTHAIEYRAYTIVDGSKFYSNTLLRRVMVENSATYQSSQMIAVAYESKQLKNEGGLIEFSQYTPFNLKFAIYDPKSPEYIATDIYVGEELNTTLNVLNATETNQSIIATIAGASTITIQTDESEIELPIYINATNLTLSEITNALVMDFSAVGRNNAENNKATWYGNGYSASINGVEFNNTSGWINDALWLPSGADITFDIAPLAQDVTNTGFTFEVEFATTNVSNDDAIICDMRNSEGVGMLIKATEVSMHSKGGVVLKKKYKSEENVRIAFVINRKNGVTNKGLMFVHDNGIVSGAINFADNDDFISDKAMKFEGSDDAEVLLKRIRIYNDALTLDQVLNNYNLYRPNAQEMMSVYERNDIYENGTLTIDVAKCQSQLPVMMVTGDIPTLENTTNKDTQIVVDIEYTNLQDPSKSFTMKGAAMRPQGTSSMLYPKKNFRIYSRQLEQTQVFDSLGKEVADRLYSFKDNAQPVDCWCLKADYAESSGTHNTGIARLFKDILYNAEIDGEFKLRTEAQKKALESEYMYDVRMSIDGFPILLFYKPNEDAEAIFIGKYNFNNDKSTESVFGFEGIPNFDNKNVECWEVLNNGNDIALFKSVANFDTKWKDAFESRYPDTKTPKTTNLKAFCTWVSSMNGKAEDFATQKWEHLDVYKVAAYYIYLMRFGAVDQVVKNSMLSTENGTHYYFQWYDNDTVNGLVNNGILKLDPTIDRQSFEPDTNDQAYAYAGHDSVLWNMLENDSEFMEIVKKVDKAMYAAGLTYDKAIEMFNEKQAGKWAERIYNQDAQYKYISPYVESGVNNLPMLQGNRSSHRKWWLSKRFSLYDSKFVSGDFIGKALEFKVINNTEGGWAFQIEAGNDMEYGYGVYNPIEVGVALAKGDTHDFQVTDTLNIGDPVRIYNATNLQGVNLANIASRLSNIELNNVYNEALGTKLKRLILGSYGFENSTLTSISSLNKAKRLEELDIQGFKAIKSIDLSKLFYLKNFIATNSGLTSVKFAEGSPLTQVSLPDGVTEVNFVQLPKLTSRGITFGWNKVTKLHVSRCPKLASDMSFFTKWINYISTPSEYTLYIDNIDWKGVIPEDFLKFCTFKNNGANVTLKGKVKLTTSSQEIIDAITNAFGSSVFKPNGELYINAPDAIYLAGPDELWQGESAQYTAAVFSENYGKVTYSIVSSTPSKVVLDATTGMVTTTETGNSDTTFTIRAQHKPTSGQVVYVDKVISYKKRIYPTSGLTISGSAGVSAEQQTYKLTWTTTNVNGVFNVEWTLTGDITSYVEIYSYNKETCVLRKISDPLEEVTGTLKAQIKYLYDNSNGYSTTKALSCFNPDIIMTSTTNQKFMAACYAAGLCANETFMTKEEAANVIDIQLGDGTSSGAKFKSKGITSLEELQYFTSLISIPAYSFRGNKIKTIILPPNIETVGSYAFDWGMSSASDMQYATGVKIVLNEGLREIGEKAFHAGYGTDNDAWGYMDNKPKYIKDLDINFPSTLEKIGVNAFGMFNIPNILEKLSNTNIKTLYKESLQCCILPEHIEWVVPSTLTYCNSPFGTIPSKNFEKVVIDNSFSTFSLSSITTYPSLFLGENGEVPIRILKYCKELQLHKDNKYYTIDGGLVFNKEKTKLLCVPFHLDIDTLYFPDMEYEKYDGFWNNLYIKKIVLPNKTSDAFGFRNPAILSSCEEVVIPEGSTSLTKDEYGNILYKQSSYIYHYVILGGLESLINDDTIYNIHSAYLLCGEKCCVNNKYIRIKTIANSNSSMYFRCPKLERYELGFSYFIPTHCETKNILIETSYFNYSSISSGSFSNSPNIEDFVFPEGVKAINKTVLNNCETLKTITLPTTCTSAYPDLGWGSPFCSTFIVKCTTYPFKYFASYDYPDEDTTKFAGYANKDTGQNIMFAPVDASFDETTSHFKTHFISYGGFTLSKTLVIE